MDRKELKLVKESAFIIGQNAARNSAPRIPDDNNEIMAFLRSLNLRDIHFNEACIISANVFRSFSNGFTEMYLSIKQSEVVLDNSEKSTNSGRNISDSERAIILLKKVTRLEKEVERLSTKCRDMHYSTHSKAQIGKANTNLNWACMELEKAKVDFLRFLEKSTLYVGSEERVMRPGGFHSYIH